VEMNRVRGGGRRAKTINAVRACRNRLLDRGYKVYMSPSWSPWPVDLVIHTAQGWRGLQVRCVAPTRRGQLRVHFACRGTRKDAWNTGVEPSYYADSGVDFFAMYDERHHVFYVVPIRDVAQKSGIVLRPRYWEAWRVIEPAPCLKRRKDDGQMTLL
jgi:hypothetical protein